VLPTVEFCRDLGITLSSNLMSMSRYINEIVVKAIERVNCTFRSFVLGHVRLLVPAFTVYSTCDGATYRPILSPHLIGLNEIDYIPMLSRAYLCVS